MHLADFVNGNAYKPDDFGERGYRVVRIRQLLDESAEFDLAPVPDRPVWLDDGDLVFSWSATLAVRFWHRGKALLNQHLFRVDVHPIVEKRWFRYVLDEGVQRLMPLMHGSAMTHITIDMLKSLTIDVPSLPDQSAIADYLDRETARIDALIAAKRRLTELAKDAATSELLSVLPANFPDAARPFRRVARKVLRPAPSVLPVITAFRDGHVMRRDRRREEGFTQSEDYSGYQVVERGQIVFHGLDGFAGAVGVAEDDGMCSPVYHVCNALGGCSAEYLAQALRSLALGGYLELQAGNVRQRAVDMRNWEKLARIPIPMVGPDQQAEIARRYLERRSWMEHVVSKLDRQVALLQEHRQALITAAVTGELDIPQAA